MKEFILCFYIFLFAQLSLNNNPCETNFFNDNQKNTYFQNQNNSDVCNLCTCISKNAKPSCKIYECIELDCTSTHKEISKCCMKNDCNGAKQNSKNIFTSLEIIKTGSRIAGLTENVLSLGEKLLKNPDTITNHTTDTLDKMFHLGTEKKTKELFQGQLGNTDELKMQLNSCQLELMSVADKKTNDEIQSIGNFIKNYIGNNETNGNKIFVVIEFVAEFRKTFPADYEIIRNVTIQGMNAVCNMTGISPGVLTAYIVGLLLLISSIGICVYHYIQRQRELHIGYKIPGKESSICSNSTDNLNEIKNSHANEL